MAVDSTEPPSLLCHATWRAQEDLGTADGLDVAAPFSRLASGHPVLWATEASSRAVLKDRLREKLVVFEQAEIKVEIQS